MKTTDNKMIMNCFDDYINNNDIERFEDAENAIDEAYQYLLTGDKSSKQYNKLEDILGWCIATQERQGFIQGFKYAMRLMKECGI